MSSRYIIMAKDIGNSLQFKLINDFNIDQIIDNIIKKRVIYIGRVDLYINPAVLTIHGFDFETNQSTLVYITNKFNDITKETLLRSLQLDPNERYYFRFDGVFIDMNSTMTPDNTIILYSIKAMLDQLSEEFDEFFDMINYNIQDYLLEYPEDNI